MTVETLATFMERQFGELAEDASRVLIEAGNVTHERSLEAKDASRLMTNEVYGASFWLNLPRQVSGRLEPVLPGVVRIRPSSSRYSLLAWHGTVIFPVKVMDRSSTGADSMRVRVSDLRRELFALNPPAERPGNLFDLLDDSVELDSHGDSQNMADDAHLALSRSADAMMIVAYLCTADGGLQGVHVGTGSLDPEGYIVWTERQSLSLLDELSLVTTPRLAGGEAFNDTPPLRPALGFVGDEDEATAAGPIRLSAPDATRSTDANPE